MDVEIIIGDCASNVMGYLVKGHVPSASLESAVRRQHDEDFEIKYAKSVEQTVMRKIPAPWHDEWLFTYEYSEPGRGAFECTVAWLE